MLGGFFAYLAAIGWGGAFICIACRSQFKRDNIREDSAFCGKCCSASRCCAAATQDSTWEPATYCEPYSTWNPRFISGSCSL